MTMDVAWVLNAAEMVSSFQEASRRREIGEWRGCLTMEGEKEDLDMVHRGGPPSLPTFDMRSMTGDTVDHAVNVMVELLPDLPRLPFPACFVIPPWNLEAMVPGGPQPSIIVHIRESPEGLVLSHYTLLQDGWMRGPINQVYLSDPATRIGKNPQVMNEIGVTFGDDETRDFHLEWANYFSACALAAFAMLMQGTAETEFEPLSPAVRAENKRRRLRHVAPVLPARILRLSALGRARLDAARAASPSGIIRSPHDRRSHMRRLRDGRVIPVKASAIHGGSTAPPVYELHS